jgi:hypothetical protein
MFDIAMSRPTFLVQDFLRKKRAGDLGIEVEVESIGGLPGVLPDTWDVKEDTSLRNVGVEYFTRNPILCNSKKFEKIKGLTDLLDKYPVIKDCPRTSIHIHMNILRHTPLQVWTAVATYWLLDNILVKYCGTEEREGNVFCLRAKDAENIVKSVIDDIREPYPFRTLYGDHLRYSSQNINAIRQFGSLEYRAMRGTLDPEIIDIWSTQLYNIVHQSKRFTDPANMMDTYLALGADRWMGLIMDEPFIKTLYQYGNASALIKENIGLLIEMCYYCDWKRWEECINKLHSKKPHTYDEMGDFRR